MTSTRGGQFAPDTGGQLHRILHHHLRTNNLKEKVSNSVSIFCAGVRNSYKGSPERLGAAQNKIYTFSQSLVPQFLCSRSIFFWHPLHLSARSRVEPSCLKNYQRFALVSGWFWCEFETIFVSSGLLMWYGIMKSTAFKSAGSSSCLKSLFFRGFFFSTLISNWQEDYPFLT